MDGGDGGGEKTMITLPKEFIFQSTMVDNNDNNNSNSNNIATEDVENIWDVNLALQLLKECQLGEKSSMYGYVEVISMDRFKVGWIDFYLLFFMFFNCSIFQINNHLTMTYLFCV